jgi:hypothetical protein
MKRTLLSFLLASTLIFALTAQSASAMQGTTCGCNANPLACHRNRAAVALAGGVFALYGYNILAPLANSFPAYSKLIYTVGYGVPATTFAYAAYYWATSESETVDGRLRSK